METVGDFARDGYAIVPTPIFPAAVIDRASAGITATLAGMERVTEYTDVVTGKRINGLTTDSHGPPVTLASDGVSELLAHPCVHPTTICVHHQPHTSGRKANPLLRCIAG